MNFWHIQLHPGDDKTVDRKRVVSILRDYSIIGMGSEWENDRGQPDKFMNDMKIGDVVMVRSNGPLALVQVTGNYEENTANKVWFELVRKVKILSMEGEEEKRRFKKQFNRSWNENLYLPTTLESTNSLFVKNWYYRTIKEQLMENIALTEKRQAELRELWERFKTGQSQAEVEKTQKELSSTLISWKEYRTKILDGTLSIDDYTNRIRSESALMPDGYLCNFLERGSKVIFGSSKPGNANNFEVKLNSNGTDYTVRADLHHGEKENNNDRETATKVFNESIKPLLQRIVKADGALEKVDIIEGCDYAAKQVLRKIGALENRGDFLYMYSDDVLNSLHGEFLNSEESRNLGKNYEVRAIINQILGIDGSNDAESVLLSRFLWKYATISGLADEDSPNVILYGPPGTGKTFSVKNSLDFLCQGDRSRYEFVQFHPSFTYEDFIEGVKPKGVTANGNIEFELVDGVFKRFCKRAKQNPDKSYYFIVDEINRANLSSVFGETLLCIEKDYRHDSQGNNHENLVKTQYSTLITEMIKKDPENESLAYVAIPDPQTSEVNAYFGVPKNLFFIGMMNDVDKSIDAFDLALRRRFKWIRKDCDLDVVAEETRHRNGDGFKNIEIYVMAAGKLNNYISDELGLGKSYEFGHSFFMKMTGIANHTVISAKNVEQLFNLHLRPTLQEYLRSMYPQKELGKVVEKALEEFKKPFY